MPVCALRLQARVGAGFCVYAYTPVALIPLPFASAIHDTQITSAPPSVANFGLDARGKSNGRRFGAMQVMYRDSEVVTLKL